MTISNRVRKFLDDSGVAYEHLEHAPVYTAQEAAQAVHTPGKEFAKTVIVRDREGFAMAVLPATRKIDLDALRAAAGRSSLELASEAEFRDLFPHCETGAMAPFGNLYDLPIFVDQSLREDATITFNAGTHADAIRMPYESYERLVRPVVAAFSRPV
jgi:Ala-tRNA(Pro) deacylase